MLNLIKKFGQNQILISTQIKKKKAKNDFEKYIFTLMNNAVFGKTMENVKKKNRDIKLVATEKRRNYLASEQNCHTRI